MEGKNDYYTFKYINEIIFGNQFELNFYPGNGADRNDYIIATYLSWGRDFSILLDGDKAGLEARKRYVKEFGRTVEDKIITLKDINPTFAFATESLFTEQELLQIIQTFDPVATEFNKSKFNTALQDLYVQEQPIELSEKTVQNFADILNFFI